MLRSFYPTSGSGQLMKICHVVKLYLLHFICDSCHWLDSYTIVFVCTVCTESMSISAKGLSELVEGGELNGMVTVEWKLKLNAVLLLPFVSIIIMYS